MLLQSGPTSLTLLAFAHCSDAAPLTAPRNVMSLKLACSQPPSSRALVSKRIKTNATTLTAIEGGSGYTVPLQFGKDTFDVIFDTGSSDLWLASSKLKCVDAEKNPLSQESCGFGPLFNSTFSDGRIADQHFSIQYGDGEFLTGEMGYQDVTFSGITVDNQQVALVDYGYWYGDEESSGLLGFAYPSITSAYQGIDPSKDSINNSITYDPFFWNAFQQGKVESIFSLALTRETEGEAGQLAFGCLPDIPHKGNFVSTPLEIYHYPGSFIKSTNFTFYTIVPDAYILYNNSAKEYFDSEAQRFEIDIPGNAGNMTPVSIDSGTTLTYLPTVLAAAVNALFDPPAIYFEDQDIYEVNCDAIPPTFGICIGGQDFYFDSQDLLLTGEIGFDPDTGMCVTGIQPDAIGPFILGGNFLKNVVAVFDVGNVEMRFAAQA